VHSNATSKPDQLHWAERTGGVLTLAAALCFLYQAAIFAGWLSP
jgi:hypothetical protein